MKFVNSTAVGVSGTHFQGYTKEVKYEDVVKAFGEPTCSYSYDEKVTVEWCLKFEDGTVATIYDYKTYNTPMYPYQWHIGGFNQKAVEHVNAVLNRKE